MIDEILNKFGIKFEELTGEERKTLETWTQALTAGQLTMESVREYLRAMKDSVEEALESEPEIVYLLGIFKVANRNHVFLKARLRNYRMLLDFLSTPERARKAIEKSLSTLSQNKSI